MVQSGPFNFNVTSRIFPNRAMRPAVAPFRLLGLIVSGCISALVASAQSLPIEAPAPGLIETGTPSFVVLGPEALGLTTAPVDLQQLPDGRLLAVGHQELALGDGVRWEVFRQANGDRQVDTLSVAVDKDGLVYAGVPGGFARIDFEPDAHWRYTLIEKLPAGQNPDTPPLVNTAIAGDEWLWWWGSGPIFSWRPGAAARMVGRANAPERAFLLDGTIHLSDYATGELFGMENGVLKTDSPAGPVSARRTITSLVSLGEGRALVGTNANGVLLSEGTNFKPLVANGLLAGERRINDLCATEGGLFAAAVDNVGIVFFDRTGRTVQVLDRSVDHRLARVKRVLSTPGGMVWGLLNEGIVRVGFPDQVSHFEPLLSTSLANAQPYRYSGKLWLRADARAQRGVYSEDNRLERFEIDSPPGLTTTLAELDGQLLACGPENVFVREAEGKWTLVATGPRSSYICPQSVAPGRWLYLAENEIGWVRQSGQGFSIERIPAPGLGHVYGGIMDAQGMFWAELGTAKVARIDATKERPSVEIFGPPDGVPDGWVQVFAIDGKVRINVSEKIEIFDAASRRFVPDQKLLQQIPELAGAVGRPTRDAHGRLWITNHGRVHIYSSLAGRFEESAEVIPDELLPMHFSPQGDGVVWMHQRMQLTRYDPAFPTAPVPPLRTLITRVQFPASNRELFSVGNELPDLAASDNALVVHFLAPNNSIRQPVTFEVNLEGMNGGWVSTGAIGSAAFNHLDPGMYELLVRARSGLTVGSEAKLAFTILAPWYRTNYAYLAYTLSALGIVLLAAWLSTLIERRENNRLERLVALRTNELNESNTRLASQVDEIQMLSQAIGQSPVGVLITRPDGIIVFANPRTCDLTGYALNELIGKKQSLLQSEETPPTVLQELAATIRQGESWHGQLAKRRKDGGTVQVRTTVSPIRSPDGQIRLHLVLEEDVTAWLADQERQQRLESQLAQSQKLESLGTLAGGIAHDFNNILTGILGYCELSMLSAPDEPELQEQLRQIRTAGLRAKDLVAQILTFSRRNTTQLVPLDLARPVEEALKLFRASTPATIELKSSLEGGTVNADATQIQQVVLNLCTNAAHAMHDRPGRLTVTVRRIMVDARLAAEVSGLSFGPAMCLAVSDTGHGMDQATLARIFDPFFTTKRQGEGTGLGLSIVQGVMTSHHGALRVQSTLGTGTTFELYFPISPDHIPPPTATDNVPQGSQQEILLVDDEAAVVDFIATRLRQLGYRVTPFNDPRLALLAIRAAPARFQAIVTDLTMPHLTGMQLIQEARLSSPGLAAVIITGYGHAAGGSQFDLLPRSRMLYKPFSGEDLARILSQVLAARPAR